MNKTVSFCFARIRCFLLVDVYEVCIRDDQVHYSVYLFNQLNYLHLLSSEWTRCKLDLGGTSWKLFILA